MFDFENKPVKDWTLAEAKEYCENKHGNKCYDFETEEELLSYCKIAECNACYEEPKNYSLINIPKFAPDEIAFCRLIKNTYPWAKYIAREKSGGLRILSEIYIIDGIFCKTPGGESLDLNNSFFPQIKPMTYYSINDIIEQGENNDA